MASDGQLTLAQTTLLDTSEKHDFVIPPQASIDSTPQQQKQHMEAAHTYLLQQAYPTIQNLIPLHNDATKNSGPSYMIRLDTVGSFLKPQPHVFITTDPGGVRVAEIVFHVRGWDATILYKNNKYNNDNNNNNNNTRQNLTLQQISQEEEDQMTFACSIAGKPHKWHPLGPSKSVFELTEETETETNKRVALFVYEEGMVQRTGSTSSSAGDRTLAQAARKIGQVHIIASFDSWRNNDCCDSVALQQTLFSAIAVVEQARRRATAGVKSWGETSGERKSSLKEGRRRGGRWGGAT